MRICRAARSLGCKNMEQGVADNPVEEGRARREVKNADDSHPWPMIRLTADYNIKYKCQL